MATLDARLSALEARSTTRGAWPWHDEAWCNEVAARLEQENADRVARGEPDPTPEEVAAGVRELSDELRRARAQG